MLELLIVIAVVAGLGLLVAAGSKLGVGSPDSLVGLFVLPEMPDRPRGVQESDLPPLVFPESTKADRGRAAGYAVDVRVHESAAA